MKLITSLFFLIISFSVLAQHVSEETALIVAKNFYNERQQLVFKKAQTNIKFVQPQKTKKALSDNFYIFNTEDNTGFVIVSANKKSYPVLGYSFSGSFSEENIPTEVGEWMKMYDEQIQQLKSLKTSASSKTSQAWEKYSSTAFKTTTNKLVEEPLFDVAPLLSTTWNQGAYYNALCPECSTGGSGGHVWAGCVATAVGQLMKYWNYPTSGVGEHSYTHSVYGVQSADFQNTIYDWASMPNSLSSHNNAVATLLYHLGVSVNMAYSPTGSGAYSSTARSSMINYFKYSANTILTSKYNYTEDNWKKLLRTEIDEGRPMYYAGYGSGGHAFNCDGYQGVDYFHFNWGWGGAYNGYFYVNDLTPGGSNFNNSQSAIVGVLPNTMELVFDSTSVITLSCSTPYSGTTADGENNANLYDGLSWHETGKEKLHKITTTSPGRITAKITGLTNNLDILILKYANRATMLTYGDSIAVLDNAEAGIYYIVVDGRYAEDGNYTLEVICPDNRADLIVENPQVDPQYVQSEQNFQANCLIRNIGNSDASSNILKYYVSDDQSFSGDDVFISSESINPINAKESVSVSKLLTLPAGLTSGTKYIIFHVDANDEVDETDNNMNFASAYFSVPNTGIMDCSTAINLADNELYTGNTLLDGDSVIDNYLWFASLTNKEIIHSFTPEYTGLATIEFSESLEGSTKAILLSSCNENSCIRAFEIWEPTDTTITESFHVTGGVTYYLVIDGNTDMGNSEGAYSVRLHYPTACPEPIISKASSVDKCDGDHAAYLYTDWAYPNFQWFKNGVEIAGANNSGFSAVETGFYTVKVTENACTGTSEGVQVTFSPKPSGTEISALSDTSFCEGGSVTLQLVTGTGYTYQWTNNDESIAGAIGLNFEASESGIYCAEVTNLSCTIKSNPKTVTAYHSAKGNGDILDFSTDSLISCWPFDNWGFDESGNNNYAGINAFLAKDRNNQSTAFLFNGADNYIYTSKQFEQPDTFTISLWFKTAGSGKLIGFDEQQFLEVSANSDRHIYLDNSGIVHFGIEGGTKQVISSTAAYNDNQWHMVSACLSPLGIKLYVDAQLVAENSSLISAGAYSGYWKMGQGKLTDWPNAPTSEYFEGKLDDIFIYSRELASDEIEVLFSTQKLKIYTEDESIEGTSGSTNIIIENSEPNIEYQLKNADNDSPIGATVQGNAGTISMPTGNMTETSRFRIFATNLTTWCSTNLDTVITVYVNVTGVENHFEASEIRIFPNPAKEYIEIDFPAKFTGNLLIEMRNSSGKLVWRKSYSANYGLQQEKIKVNSYPAGLYFLNFSNDKNYISKKLVLE